MVITYYIIFLQKFKYIRPHKYKAVLMKKKLVFEILKISFDYNFVMNNLRTLNDFECINY